MLNIDTLYIGRIIVEAKDTPINPNIPEPYQQYSRVFSEDASHEFPPLHIWDHTIELKPNTPAALPGKLIPLSQAEQEELHKFVVEHTKRGTIRPSKSPYKVCFFYIKRRMENYDQCKTTDPSTNGPYTMPTLFLSYQNLSTG
jgi:hypothetical protein